MVPSHSCHPLSCRCLDPHDHAYWEQQRPFLALLAAWDQLSTADRIKFLIQTPTPAERRGMLEGLPEEQP